MVSRVISTVWSGIVTAVTTYITIVRTVVETVFNVIRSVIETVMGVVSRVISTVWSGIVTAVTLYVNVVRTVVETVFNVIRAVIETVMGVIRTVIENVWRGIQIVVTTYVNLVRTVVETVFNAIRAVVSTIMTGIQIVIAVAWDVISGIWNRGVGILRTVTDTVMGAVSGAFNTGLETVKRLFSGAVDAIGRIWDRVTGVVKAPIRGMFEWINDWMIDPINAVLGKFSDSVKLGRIPLPAFHTGGFTGDKLVGREGLALLRNDEFVMNPDATRKNRPLLEALNAGMKGFGIGGPFDIIADVAGAIGDLVAKGAAFAVDAVADPLLNKAREQYGGQWGPDVVLGGMEHVVKQVKNWATSRDQQQAAMAAAVGTATGAGYIGPSSGILGKPLNPYVVTSEFGPRWGTMHAGIDLGAPGGQPIYAAAAGKVMTAGWYDGYGNYLALDHGNGLSTTYGHMSAIAAAAGQILAAGQVLGYVGTTGDSTGNHLHFETRQNGAAVNPRQFVAFDRGGLLQPGWSAVYNGTGRPEPVLTDRQWANLTAAVGSGGPTINIVNNYPQAEPASVSTARALRTLSMAGGL